MHGGTPVWFRGYTSSVEEKALHTPHEKKLIINVRKLKVTKPMNRFISNRYKNEKKMQNKQKPTLQRNIVGAKESRKENPESKKLFVGKKCCCLYRARRPKPSCFVVLASPGCEKKTFARYDRGRNIVGVIPDAHATIEVTIFRLFFPE